MDDIEQENIWYSLEKICRTKHVFISWTCQEKCKWLFSVLLGSWRCFLNTCCTSGQGWSPSSWLEVFSIQLLLCLPNKSLKSEFLTILEKALDTIRSECRNFQSSHNSWKFAHFSVAPEREIMIGVPLRSESIQHRLGKKPFLHWIFCRLFCPYFRRRRHHNLLTAYRNMLHTETFHALLQKRVWTLSMPTLLCPWMKYLTLQYTIKEY